MIRLLLLCLALLAAPAAIAADAPRLVLVIVVDQMRSDYLDRFGFSKGFARLTSEGAVFANAHHGHMPTETGPGHSVILTGQYPSVHGIAANKWWDPQSGAPMECMTDAVHGLGPQNLLAYTLGDALKARDPRARVVAVSLKDRAAIPLAGRRGDLALWHDKKSQLVATSSYYGPAPAWIAGLGGDPDKIRYAPVGDELVLELATRALKHLPLGRDEVTDVLAVSFSSPDYVGHNFGIDGPQLAQQYAALDATLQALLERAEAQAGAGRLLVALTADHGVVPSPEDPSGQAMGVRRYLFADWQRALEARLQKIVPAPRPWVRYTDVPNVYLDRGLARERKIDWSDFVDQAAKAARELPGVAAVHTEETVNESDAVRRGYYPGRSGDLIVVPQRGALFSEHKTGTSHGTPYEYDTHVPLILWGSAFKPGTYDAPAFIVSLAPTLAQVLGLPWKAGPEAPVLGAALR